MVEKYVGDGGCSFSARVGPHHCACCFGRRRGVAFFATGSSFPGDHRTRSPVAIAGLVSNLTTAATSTHWRGRFESKDAPPEAHGHANYSVRQYVHRRSAVHATHIGYFVPGDSGSMGRFTPTIRRVLGVVSPRKDKRHERQPNSHLLGKRHHLVVSLLGLDIPAGVGSNRRPLDSWCRKFGG
ncbi:unnamed protein product, partial [Ectocarpus sp. 8 AP-2014]